MLSLHRLTDIPAADWLALVNDPVVRRHMPLAGTTIWTEQTALDWAAGKDRQWTENGYGPWAFKVDGLFAGWGGFQKEGDDADLGLVLFPRFWGYGRYVFREVVARGWNEFGFASISILLPPSRTHLGGLKRLGFVADGEIDYDGHRFLKFRLYRP